MTNSTTVGYVKNAQAKDSSCKVRGARAGAGVTTNSTGTECSFTYNEFLQMYNDYASDTEGKYSPIVIHSVYYNTKTKKEQPHAFTVIGRDESNPEYFYVVDSGYSNNAGIGKVKFAQEGQMRVADYQIVKADTGKWGTSTNKFYSADYILMGVWQYYKD